MKIMIILAVLSLCSCQMDIDDLKDVGYSYLADGHELTYREEWTDIQTIQQAAQWAKAEIYYEDDGDLDIWSNPEIVLSRGYGDCDDYALLMMNICYVALNIKPDLVLRLVEDRTVDIGGSVNHCEIRIGGENYSVYTGLCLGEIENGFSYSFEHVFGEEK